MAALPKVDQRALRTLKAESDRRVSSVARVALVEATFRCFSRVYSCPTKRVGNRRECAESDNCRLRRAYFPSRT
jgi:hypothetical protein